MRHLPTFLVLLAVKIFCLLTYRVRFHWLGAADGDPWKDIRIAAILNHTSLYEPIFAAAVPPRFLWRLAYHGVVPVAEKTLRRPLVGRFFSFIAAHVVPLTRQRDHTWRQLLSQVDDPESIVIILPEGRMMRRNGLDAEGKPMTIRAGIGDLVEAVPEGRLLLAYSQGLHHVQAPGERLPRLFKTVDLTLESLDIAAYREAMLEEGGARGLRQAVVADLTRRRALHCPPPPDAEG